MQIKNTPNTLDNACMWAKNIHKHVDTYSVKHTTEEIGTMQHAYRMNQVLELKLGKMTYK